MTLSEPVSMAGQHAPSSVPSCSIATPALGLTIFGCGRTEAAAFRERSPGFGVVPTIVDDPLSESNVDSARGNRCISVDHKTPITNVTLIALSRAGVSYLSTRSIGCNHIDVAYAQSLGIRIGTVSYSPDSVADYTLMLMLMALRDAKALIRRTDLHDYRLEQAPGRELRDQTVGVIGTGRIGTAVIDRLAGFGCRIVAYDRHPTGPVRYVGLDELLRESDIITLHTPLDANTYHLIDRRRMSKMKTGALLVNTARGSLVETEALLSSLETGRLGGAALDVIEGEHGIFYADRRDRPVENEMLLRLQQLPNVLISPHTAYYTDHALRDIVEQTLGNCVSYERKTRA